MIQYIIKNEPSLSSKIKNIKHVTKNKFSNEIFGVKNQELKKSLEEFSKVYKKK